MTNDTALVMVPREEEGGCRAGSACRLQRSFVNEDGREGSSQLHLEAMEKHSNEIEIPSLHAHEVHDGPEAKEKEFDVLPYLERAEYVDTVDACDEGGLDWNTNPMADLYDSRNENANSERLLSKSRSTAELSLSHGDPSPQPSSPAFSVGSSLASHVPHVPQSRYFAAPTSSSTSFSSSSASSPGSILSDLFILKYQEPIFPGTRAALVINPEVLLQLLRHINTHQSQGLRIGVLLSSKTPQSSSSSFMALQNRGERKQIIGGDSSSGGGTGRICNGVGNSMGGGPDDGSGNRTDCRSGGGGTNAIPGRSDGGNCCERNLVIDGSRRKWGVNSKAHLHNLLRSDLIDAKGRDFKGSIGSDGADYASLGEATAFHESGNTNGLHHINSGKLSSTFIGSDKVLCDGISDGSVRHGTGSFNMILEGAASATSKSNLPSSSTAQALQELAVSSNQIGGQINHPDNQNCNHLTEPHCTSRHDNAILLFEGVDKPLRCSDMTSGDSRGGGGLEGHSGDNRVDKAKQRHDQLQYKIGCICQLDHMSKTSGGAALLVDGLTRFKILEISVSHLAYCIGHVILMPDDAEGEEDQVELQGLTLALRQRVEEYLHLISSASSTPSSSLPSSSNSITFSSSSSSSVVPPFRFNSHSLIIPSSPASLADFAASLLTQITPESRQRILETMDVRKRLFMILSYLGKLLEAHRLSERINNRIEKQLSREVKEVLIMRKMGELRRELQQLQKERRNMRKRQSTKSSSSNSSSSSSEPSSKSVHGSRKKKDDHGQIGWSGDRTKNDSKNSNRHDHHGLNDGNDDKRRKSKIKDGNEDGGGDGGGDVVDRGNFGGGDRASNQHQIQEKGENGERISGDDAEEYDEDEDEDGSGSNDEGDDEWELDGAEDDEDDIVVLRNSLKAAKLSEEAAKSARKELRRLKVVQPHHPEYLVSRTYLETLAAMPWEKSSIDDLDVDRAQRVLEEDHYGLHMVKKRIIEFLAVRRLRGDNKMRGPILCLVGPPGVGKTSLGQSVARTMRRKFRRISLGGLRDEAELRGHRRTYIGALPGAIVQALLSCGVRNPVLLLDEIDKLSYRNSAHNPAAALLEVVDSAQNFAFKDHYLGVPFDLSEVFFICTANSLHPMPRPLRDRLEVINLSGYTTYEKLNIAQQHLLPNQLEVHGLIINKALLSPLVAQSLNSTDRKSKSKASSSSTSFASLSTDSSTAVLPYPSTPSRVSLSYPLSSSPFPPLSSSNPLATSSRATRSLPHSSVAMFPSSSASRVSPKSDDNELYGSQDDCTTEIPQASTNCYQDQRQDEGESEDVPYPNFCGGKLPENTKCNLATASTMNPSISSSVSSVGGGRSMPSFLRHILYDTDSANCRVVDNAQVSDRSVVASDDPEVDGNDIVKRRAEQWPLLCVRDDALLAIIVRYTAESGVRELDRCLAALCRYAALKLRHHSFFSTSSPPSQASPQTKEKKSTDIPASSQAKQSSLSQTLVSQTYQSLSNTNDVIHINRSCPDVPDPVVITTTHLTEILGPELYLPNVAERLRYPGVAVGLAVSAAGGDLLFIEATKVKGNGKLIVTGQLGDVMQESVRAALSLLQARAFLSQEGRYRCSNALRPSFYSPSSLPPPSHPSPPSPSPSSPCPSSPPSFPSPSPSSSSPSSSPSSSSPSAPSFFPASASTHSSSPSSPSLSPSQASSSSPSSSPFSSSPSSPPPSSSSSPSSSPSSSSGSSTSPPLFLPSSITLPFLSECPPLQSSPDTVSPALPRKASILSPFNYTISTSAMSHLPTYMTNCCKDHDTNEGAFDDKAIANRDCDRQFIDSRGASLSTNIDHHRSNNRRQGGNNLRGCDMQETFDDESIAKLLTFARVERGDESSSRLDDIRNGGSNIGFNDGKIMRYCVIDGGKNCVKKNNNGSSISSDTSTKERMIARRLVYSAIPLSDFQSIDIHVHFPAGSVAKDGPSAGLATAVALASLFSGKVVRSDTAFTGEVTLRGHVLAVGGIREKVLAAHRAGIKRVVMPFANEAAVSGIPDEVRRELMIGFVKDFDEALVFAFDHGTVVDKGNRPMSSSAGGCVRSKSSGGDSDTSIDFDPDDTVLPENAIHFECENSQPRTLENRSLSYCDALHIESDKIDDNDHGTCVRTNMSSPSGQNFGPKSLRVSCHSSSRRFQQCPSEALLSAVISHDKRTSSGKHSNRARPRSKV